MDTVTATRAVNPIKNGVTKPFVLACNNLDNYIVKFMENPFGLRVLANEYICARLGEHLELPLPEPVLVNLSPNFIDDYGHQVSDHIGEQITLGRHFGTRKIRKITPITSSRVLLEASNYDIIPEIIVFDQFICNPDRDDNGGNLLLNIETKEIIIIDHTHVFDLGSIWDKTQLSMRIGQPFDVFNASGNVYKKLIPHINGHNPFGPILDKLSRMTDQQLWHIINDVPVEWGVSEEEKEMLHNYLMDRKERIEEVLPLMKNHLPRWKGGAG